MARFIFSLDHTLKFHVLETATVKFGASLKGKMLRDAEECLIEKGKDSLSPYPCHHLCMPSF